MTPTPPLSQREETYQVHLLAAPLKTRTASFCLNLGDVSSKESSSLRKETFLLPVPRVGKGNAFLNPVGKTSLNQKTAQKVIER